MEKITTAASVSAAWRGMSDEEQYTALQKMAWTVRRGGSKRGAEWIQTQDDAMNVAAEAWLRMGAALERNERADEPRPLNLILYSACAQAANTIARREKRYGGSALELYNALMRQPTTDMGYAWIRRVFQAVDIGAAEIQQWFAAE